MRSRRASAAARAPASRCCRARPTQAARTWAPTLSGHALARRLDAEGAVLFAVVFVSEPRSFTLHAIRLDADARPEPPLTLLRGDVRLELRASASDGGYVLFDPGNGSEALARFVPASLDRVSDAVAIDPGVDGSSLSFDFLRIPGGFVAVSGLAILRLDPEGRPTASWHGRLAPGDDEGNTYVVSPDLATRDGRLFLTWHGIAEDSTPNTVWIRELGCVEE